MTPAALDILAANLAERLTTPRWLKLRQAVQYAGIGKTNMARLLKAGEIDGYQNNDRGDWIVDKESIDRYHMGNMAQGDEDFVAELVDSLV